MDRIIAGIILVMLGIYVLPSFGYFLPLSLLGGYDKNTLDDFNNAVELAGPSKLIVKPWSKFVSLGCRISPLHNKFPMFHENVKKEIEELMAMKRKVDSKRDIRKVSQLPR
jgi:hypothetical protein